MKVGDRLAPLLVDVSAEPMKTMAAILDDPTPIHYDAGAVRALGLGDAPVNQGPMNIGYLVELLCRRAGGAAAVRRVRVRLLDNVFAGDRVECTARVVAIDNDSGEVALELAASASGRPVLTGEATVVSRGPAA